MFKVFMPTKWFFGEGAIDELAKMDMPGKHAMIIISNGKSTRANGYLDRTEKLLESSGIKFSVFDKVEPNPLKGTIMAGGKFARENHCDFIVALGGGSVMDASKAIATMAVNDGDLWDYVAGGTGKALPIPNTPLPIVTITTTAGTGSEVDQYGVITNDVTNEKIGFGGLDSLFPKIAIIDPELMYSVPPKFTAYQGFDALFHSTECYINKFANPFSDMVASTAITNVGKYLARAVKDGKDREARSGMALANTLSGYSMVTGCCTSEHSMEHAMSAYHQNLTHGAGLIMISIEYYRYFIDKHVCDQRFIEMARMLGMTEASKPDDFITALFNLQKACGVADLKMSEAGIKPDEFDKLAKNARETMGGLFFADPYPMSDADCAEIYKLAYK